MQGKSESELVNNFIPYVVCLKPFDEAKQTPSLSDKAFSPDELLATHGKN